MTVKTASQTTSDTTEAALEPIRVYSRGVETGDVDALRRAFHPNAKLKTIEDDGKYYEITVDRLFAFMEENGAIQCTSEVLSIHVTGTAGAASVRFTLPDKIWTDYLNLLLLDGRWVIVDKIYDTRRLG